MKSVIKKIGSILLLKRTIALVLLLAACAGGLWYWQGQAASGFRSEYSVYESLAAVHENDAYVPGATANPLREELNSALALSLAKETTPKDRLTFASRAASLIAQLNAEVDAIAKSAAPVSGSIERLEKAANDPGNISRRTDMLELVSLARAELETIENIRGYSYRANFETGEIFKRITADQGVLKDSYILELNDQLPVVEEQFNKRQNLYTDLEANVYRMKQKFDILNGVS